LSDISVISFASLMTARSLLGLPITAPCIDIQHFQALKAAIHWIQICTL